MKLTIKFSTINIVILSEICYSMLTCDSSYKKEVLSKIYKIQKIYYENPEHHLFTVLMNPTEIEKILDSNYYTPPLFDSYFDWSRTEEGFKYWYNVSNIIENYYYNNETNN